VVCVRACARAGVVWCACACRWCACVRASCCGCARARVCGLPTAMPDPAADAARAGCGARARIARGSHTANQRAGRRWGASGLGVFGGGRPPLPPHVGRRVPVEDRRWAVNERFSVRRRWAHLAHASGSRRRAGKCVMKNPSPHCIYAQRSRIKGSTFPR
jgi:hypothetical protein